MFGVGTSCLSPLALIDDNMMMKARISYSLSILSKTFPVDSHSATHREYNLKT